MAFESTFWTVIKKSIGDPFAIQAIVRRYRPPVVEYLRRRGVSDADAEDLAQEIFVQVCRPEFLRRADRERGRFRSLLLAVTRNLLNSFRRRENTLKRGGSVTILSLEQGGPDGQALEMPVESLSTPDAEFGRLWASHLMKRALERLAEEERPDGAPIARALALHIEDVPYREIANRLGASEQDVANWIYQARRRMKRYARKAIEEYISSPEELQEEIRQLREYLS